MARRRLIWHLGLAHPLADPIGAGLEQHAEALADAGLRVIATPGEARLASHELLRTQETAGLARAEVEGRWARITDRVWEQKSTSLLSTPDLCAADKDQLRLALDPLIGVEVHLVLTVGPWSEQLYGGWLAELATSGAAEDEAAEGGTARPGGPGLGQGVDADWDTFVKRVSDAAGRTTGHRQAEEFWAGHDLAAVLTRWGWTFHADRLHVLVAPDPATQWAAFLDIAGAPGPEDLPVVVPVVAVEVPEVDPAPAQVLLEEWAAMLPAAGYDVRGELAHPGARGSLAVADGAGMAPVVDPAVSALAGVLVENHRLRARVARLEIENERLDRKRRKHKRRVRQLQATSGSVSEG